MEILQYDLIHQWNLLLENILGKIELTGMNLHFKLSIVCWFCFHTDYILFSLAFYSI